MLVEGEERQGETPHPRHQESKVLPKLKINSLQGFHCMLVEGEERCLAKSKGRPHVPVSQKTLSLLRRFYRDHNFK
jgi:hypothetical protein